MPKFKYYNVQLLPLDTNSTQNIGPAGYKLLLNSIWDSVRLAIKAKHLESIAAPLRNDMYLVPFHVAVGEDYAIGQLLKFNHIDALRDLYTGDELQKIGQGVTNKRLTFDFVFDFKRHILAISRTPGLPSSRPLVEALAYLVEAQADEIFPQHTVRVIELTESESLEEVLRADGYKRVEVTVTFSNSEETEEEWERHLEQDLRDNNVHDVEHIERSDKNTHMNGMSEVARGLVGLATKYGNATIRYIKDQTSILYQMKDHPVMIDINRSGDQSELDFYNEIYRSIKEADARAKRKSSRQVNSG